MIIELVWTRIFSAEFFYTFAFLVLSLAVFGLGAGALTIRLFRITNDSANWIYLLLSATSIIIGPALIFLIQPEFTKAFASGTELLKTIVSVFVLALPSYFGGISLSQIFKSSPGRLPGLYMTDMISAGAGVIFAVFFMQYFQTHYTAFIAPLPLLLASFIMAKGFRKFFPVILSAISIVMMINSQTILTLPGRDKAPVEHRHWDAMAKIKIYKYNEDYKGLITDNHASSTVIGFNGDFNDPELKNYNFFGADFGSLVRRFDNCKFLALGAGGGKDVMHALVEGAAEVHAVEVNPYINYLLTSGRLASFTGNIYKDPRVKVITEDARSYIRGSDRKYDIIFSFSSNTYAALASGAFALAENYIYTKEAFVDYWNALSDNGFLVIEHHYYVPRLLSGMLEALGDLEIADYKRHFAVYGMPEWNRQLILLSKKPLDAEILKNALGGLGSKNFGIYLIYPGPPNLDNHIINRIIRDGWEKSSEYAGFKISPSTDDSPFIPQLGLWENFSLEQLANIEEFSEFLGFPLAYTVIITILGISIIIMMPLNLIPYFRPGPKLGIFQWIYFFLIGAAFMGVEVVLIQRYTLLIGVSVYSTVAVLMAMLVISGLGSRFCEKFNLKYALSIIILLLLFETAIAPEITLLFARSSVSVRILASILLISPLSFFMGMPFPLFGKNTGELIDWGFAVNGTASVIGSALAVFISISWGFSVALIFIALLYTLAFVIIFTRVDK